MTMPWLRQQNSYRFSVWLSISLSETLFQLEKTEVKCFCTINILYYLIANNLIGSVLTFYMERLNTYADTRRKKTLKTAHEGIAKLLR